MDIDLLRRDECPQQFTSEQVTAIKNAVKGRRGNVNITPYHIYDYDEHKVGEWRETVDGVKKKKPLYAKTVTITMPTKSSQTEVSHGIANIERVVTYDGSIYSSSDTSSVAGVPFGGTDGLITNWAVYIPYVTQTAIVYYRGASRNEDTASITLQYTKTTDEWEVVVE